MNNLIFPIAQISVASLLIITILLQQKGGGLSGVFGGGDDYSYHTKRGLEKILVRATIVLAILLVAISISALKFNS